jgi:dihydrofolate reductase
MRTLIVTEFMSLDGVIDSPGGEEGYAHAGWTFTDVPFVPEAYELKGREQTESTALLLGRVSYQAFAPVWPAMDEFAQYNEMPKYVVSTTLTETDPGWTPTTILHTLDAVDDLRQGDGGPIIVHGSATLAQGLATAGLVDRYHLLMFPLLLGSGKRLFATDGEFAKLELVESTAYSNGIVAAIYDVVH